MLFFAVGRILLCPFLPDDVQAIRRRVIFHPRSREARFLPIRLCPGGSKRVEGKSRVKTINPGACFLLVVVEISAAFFCCFLLGLLLYKVSFLKGGSSNTQLNGSPPFCGGGG